MVGLACGFVGDGGMAVVEFDMGSLLDFVVSDMGNLLVYVVFVSGSLVVGMRYVVFWFSSLVVGIGCIVFVVGRDGYIEFVVRIGRKWMFGYNTG